MNTLKYAEQFTQVLKNYQMSTESEKILSDIKFVMLSAISSSGRNTIIREIVATGECYFVISDTTRKMRINNGVKEQNGVEYWFRTEEEVLYDLQKGNYIEAAIIHNQQVSGISVRELKKAQAQHKCAISDIDVQGVQSIMQKTTQSVPIFILPPSYEIWMKRWKKRGDISKEEFKNRIESAKKELTFALNHDYFHFVVNDQLSEAVHSVMDIIRGYSSQEHNIRGRELALSILSKLTIL